MIINLLLKILIKILKFLRLDSSKYKIMLYRRKGYKIGGNCRIFSDLNSAEPYLINIHNNVTISTEVSLLTHDNSIVKASNGKYTDLYGEIIINDNCFIGNGCTILPGISLAKGTIVAAGSVISKSVLKENMVIGGNPAKIIGSANSFLKKNIDKGFNTNGLNKKEKKKIILNSKSKLINRKNL